MNPVYVWFLNSILFSIHNFKISLYVITLMSLGSQQNIIKMSLRGLMKLHNIGFITFLNLWECIKS